MVWGFREFGVWGFRESLGFREFNGFRVYIGHRSAQEYAFLWGPTHYGTFSLQSP